MKLAMDSQMQGMGGAMPNVGELFGDSRQVIVAVSTSVRNTTPSPWLPGPHCSPPSGIIYEPSHSCDRLAKRKEFQQWGGTILKTSDIM